MNKVSRWMAGRHRVLCACWLGLLASNASAVYVEFAQNAVNDANSNALAAVSSSQWLETGQTVTTVTAPDSWNGYRFTHWTVSGALTDPSRDPWGRALNPVSFFLSQQSTATAHYLLSTLDSDADNVPDWYEVHYFGTTTLAATSDTDNDGLTLLQEFQQGSHPLYANTNLVGGVAKAQSSLVTCNLAGYPGYILRSEPTGTVNQAAIVVPGTPVTTPNMTQTTFGYWTLDNVQQRDAWGTALRQLTFTLAASDREAVAYLFTGDTDTDGLPDAWEKFYFNTLSNGAGNDLNSDGFTLLQDYQASRPPVFGYTFQPGGISKAQSGLVTCNLAQYPQYTLRSEPTGTVNQAAIVVPGTPVTTPNMAQTTFGYWTLDGVQQRDAWGTALRQLTFTLSTSDREAVAYLFTGDSDTDSLPDAWEKFYFNTLAHGSGADLNSDSFTLLQDYQASRPPVFGYNFQPGGISKAQSSLVQFVHVYTLTVTNGTGSGAYQAGEVISITASNPPYRKLFAQWAGDTQVVASVTSTSTTVTMPARAVSLVATYTNEIIAQTISFNSLPKKRVDDAPFTLDATASSELPISYISSNPNVATVNGNTVTIIGAGITVITASQAGDATYLPVANVIQILYVAGMPGMVVGWGYNLYEQISIPPGLTNVIAIAAGGYQSLALMGDGTVVGWGYNGYGQINIPDGLTNVIAIAGGGEFSLMLKSDGTVTGCGLNNYGQLNIPSGLSNVIAIVSGYYHSLALKADGTVTGWGYNGYGQINIPDGLTNVTAIAAGSHYSLALKADGTVVGWGENGDGQINIPEGLTNVTAIAAAVAGSHCLALKANGTVVSWGRNNFEQINIPDGLTNVTAIAAGGSHSLALKGGGMVVAWGNNGYGQIGIPRELTNTTAITAGIGHSLAIMPVVLPSITSQPEDATVHVTSNVTFRVIATGTPSLFYQWLNDGVAINSATNTSLTLSNVQTNQAGSYIVMVSNAWGSVTSRVAVLTINRLAQTISFDSLPDKQTCDAPFTLSATASSGLPVNYTSSNTNVATVSGNTVTITGVGDTTITAIQAGDATYLPASNVNQPFHVTSATYLLTVSSGTGGGSYTNGAIVMITAAAAPSGQVFHQWTGATQTVASVTSATTTVTMPAQAIDVTATYKNIPAQDEVLAEDSFSGSVGAPPDASKFEWGGQVGQNGSGRLELNTDAANTSWLRSKASASPGLGQTLVLQMRAQAYAEPNIYGNGQPRGLRVGSDANNVVEFYSIWGNNIGLRVRKNGVESLLAYSFPAGVWSMHDYEISVTPTSAVFKVDGVLAGTFTTNIPTGALNIYVTTYDGGAGNVPVYIDSLSLTLKGSLAMPLDSDADGIPDSWEQQYFGGTTNATPNAVCPNGFNTVLEAYIAGLNPTNPLSRFMISNFRSLTDGKAFDWNTVSGRIYSVYWTTNLLNSFQPLETNIPWTRCSFTNSTTAPQSFYRIHVQMAD